MTDSTEDNTQAITNATLNGSGTATKSTTLLPGGQYHVWAHYGGDGKNSEGDSAKASITISPEPSGVFLNVIAPGNGTVPSGTTNIPYGTPLVFSAQVAPSSKLSALEACFTSSSACPVYGVPTGVVTFADNGTKINTAVINAEGDAEYNTIDQTVPVSATNVGAHSITASYAGDNSYNSSSASASTYTIIKADTNLAVAWPNQNLYAGQTSTITVVVESSGAGAPPTGSISVTGAPSGTTTGALSYGGVDIQSGATNSYATITFPSSTSAGNYNLGISYSGDSNYNPVAGTGTIMFASKPSQTPTTTTITTTASSTSPSTLTGITVTVTGAGTTPPTGTITLQTSNASFQPLTLVPNSGTDTSTVSIGVDNSGILQGANLLTAGYSGDSNYAPSTSAAVNLANPLSDFAMVPQSTIIPVPSSGSGSQTINLTSNNSFSGVVTLTCAGSGGVGCTFDNAAPNLTAGGNAAVKLTVDNNNVTAPGTYNVSVTGQDSTGTYIHTLALQAVVASATTLPKGLVLAGPSSLTIVNPGDSANGTVTASGQGGVTGPVTFTCSIEGSPSGITCANPAGSTITSASASSTLTVSTTATATPGNYVADVAATATVGSVPSNLLHVPIVLNPNASFGLGGTNIASLAPGATSGNTSTITLTPAGGFTGTVNLKCSLTSSPSGATNSPTCSIASTVSVTGSSPVTTPMTISSTAATSGALSRPLDKFFAVGGGITVAGLLLFGIPARRRSWRAILGVLVFATIVGLSIGCGSSGGSGGGGGGGGNSGTTAGTYTFTVNGSDAASGKITSSAQVTVTFN
jgi:hypothetical protein